MKQKCGRYKHLIGIMAAAVLLGSSMTVCAEEMTETGTAQENMQSVPQAVQSYQQMMTPEILASFQNLPAYREDDAMQAVILKNALLLRTDIWGTLQDQDGNGIDDRDPVNGCGYLDVNCNGFDDRFEMVLIQEIAREEPTQALVGVIMFEMLTHRCEHGMVYSTFQYDEREGVFISMPGYMEQCGECRKAALDRGERFETYVQQLFSK